MKLLGLCPYYVRKEILEGLIQLEMDIQLIELMGVKKRKDPAYVRIACTVNILHI